MCHRSNFYSCLKLNGIKFQCHGFKHMSMCIPWTLSFAMVDIGLLSPLPIVSDAAVNIDVQLSVENTFSILLGIYQE